MRLSELARAAEGELVGADVDVQALAIDSRQANAGHLFIAIPGAKRRGEEFVADALARGAAAVCATAPVPGVPTLVVADPRRAAALLGAAINDHPARHVALVGITGSLGKTSTALLLQAMLVAGRIRTGVIGSLGIHFRGETLETGMTTPEAPAIHGALRAMLEAGVDAVVMEVTSHAILHQRVLGLEFAIGLVTNLVPDEHLEFHPTPEHYVRTKTRFYGMMRPGAPLVINGDDDTVRRTTAPVAAPRVLVSAAGRDDAHALVDDVVMSERGSSFTLRVARPLPRLGGGEIVAGEWPLHLSVLGRQQVANAGLAATAALMIGAPPEAIREALADVQPIRRRMQLLRPDGDRGPLILDDTVGNPASIQAVFETARALRPRRLRVAYAVRGMRGLPINRHNATALAAESAASDATLVVTSSEDAADERNRVSAEERDAVVNTLRDCGAPFTFHANLADAVRETLIGAEAGDLVMLLGAQGMDRGAEIARAVMEGS